MGPLRSPCRRGATSDLRDSHSKGEGARSSTGLQLALKHSPTLPTLPPSRLGVRVRSPWLCDCPTNRAGRRVAARSWVRSPKRSPCTSSLLGGGPRRPDGSAGKAASARARGLGWATSRRPALTCRPRRHGSPGAPRPRPAEPAARPEAVVAAPVFSPSASERLVTRSSVTEQRREQGSPRQTPKTRLPAGARWWAAAGDRTPNYEDGGGRPALHAPGPVRALRSPWGSGGLAATS